MRHAGAGCLAAAVIAATLYAVTLAPTVGAGDSAELILAANGLGIPHPPGYALWLLLARLAALIPAGALALRVNAMSALSTAVAVGLFWLLARHAGQRLASRVIATVLFATASVVWASAVEAEVYGLGTAAFLMLSLLALRARRARGTTRDEALFCFAAGLATVAHQTLLFPALVLGAWVLARAERSGARGGADGAPARGGALAGRIARGLGWAALGVSMTLVIPVRSSAGPSFAWTDVHGLPGLADYLLRRTYGGLAQNPFRLDRAVDQAAGMGALVAAALGWLGGALAVIGMCASPRARRTLGPVLAAALSIPVALMLLLAFRPDAEHLAQVAPFLAPAVAAAALFAGSGAELLTRRTPIRWRSLATGALVLGALAWIPARYAEADRSGFRLAERYGRDLLALAPRGATLILEGDNETFLAAYASRHEGARPDVALEHRRGWIFGDRYGLRGRPRSEWATVAHNAEVQRIQSGAGPICYPIPPADLLGTGIPFTQRGLMYEAGAPASAASPSAPPPGWTLPAAWPRSSDLLDGHPERYDYVTRKMAVAYSDAAARWHWSRGRLGDALPWFQDAARVGFDFPGAHLNVATAAAAVGQPEVALTELLTACRLAPYDPDPAARLAIFLAAAGRPRDAALWFERAFKVEPGAALAADAARAWERAGDPARAVEWTRRASVGGRG